jgi:hypothetical protein
MSSRFLTGSRRRSEARRAATCPMTVLAIAVVSPLASAGAEERPPPASLIARGLAHAGLGTPSVSERVLAAARWLPQLRLRTIVERGDGTGLTRASTTVLGELAWPLGRTPVGDAVAAERDARQRSAARQRLVDRISEAWQRRQHAEELADDVAARLAEDEADAELDALVGDDAGDAP